MVNRVAEMAAAEALEKPFNAADPIAVNNARKKAGRKKSEDRETLATLMQYENGRKFLYESIRCIIEGNPIVMGDPYSTYFNLGQEYRARSIFQEIVRVSPKEFSLMMEEMKNGK